MTEYEASRTLVKSPPELWAELSDEASLAGHLADPFGEIRITRLEPETAVAWEGERASGTVRIEPSGWGTRVTLTARAVEADPPKPHGQLERPAPAPLPPPAPPPEPLPPAAAEPAPPAESPAPPAPEAPPRRGLRRLLGAWRRSKPPAAPDEPPATLGVVDDPPAARDEPPATLHVVDDPPPEPAAIDPEAVLVAVLDRLGAAHHRPFSRA
jgi:hypothetical protein